MPLKNKELLRFLVISTTGIGDTLMSTPAVRALRRSFPGSQIHFLVNSKRKELLYGNPHVNRILKYRNNPVFRAFLFLKTLTIRYDHVLVFHANDDIWNILRLIRFGDCYNRQGYRDSLGRVISLDSLPQHSIQKRLALVQKVGGKDSQDYRYDFFVPRDQVIWASEKLREGGISPKERLVGIQPGASDSYKRWPLESFVEVARHLRAKYGAKIYLNASNHERSLVEGFERLLGDGPVFHPAGKELSQSAALMKACSLFISNDTGPMHMAIGLGIPLIGLFCPTYAERTGPLGYPKTIVIRKEKPCDPCLFRDCPDNFCMRQISVEEVCQAADRILLGEARG